ncbi:D-glycero-alpha-D-manno-heptose-1,7-bisphosphate 7-phosphatase [Candidatus Latescibacterota bacterium]
MTISENNPARFVLLDRDGVINVDPGDYTTTIDEWEWAPGALEGIKKLTEAGFGILIITNQACIAKELQTGEGLAVLHEFMLGTIREHGGDILRIYHCPHQTSDGCDCRKPEPGMILQAAEDYGFDPAETFLIGDTPRDMEAARRAGVRGIIVSSSLLEEEEEELPGEFIAADLLEAAEIVIRETG